MPRRNHTKNGSPRKEHEEATTLLGADGKPLPKEILRQLSKHIRLFAEKGKPKAAANNDTEAA